MKNIDHTDIELLFTISEEDGLKGSKYLDVNRISSKDGYIFDSNNSPGEIITQAPAETGINVTVYGKAAHAGVCPEEGINALQVLSKAVQDMKLLRIDADTTANIGLVNGGIASHVVMPNIDIAAEVRSLYPDKLNEQINHMRRCFEKATQIYGGSFDFEEVPYYNTMYVKEDTSIVLNAIEAFKQVGIDAVTTSTGGGSDANVLNDKGLTMINLGINQKQAHTLDEHYCISDLVLLTNFVVELIKQHTLNKN